MSVRDASAPACAERLVARHVEPSDGAVGARPDLDEVAELVRDPEPEVVAGAVGRQLPVAERIREPAPAADLTHDPLSLTPDRGRAFSIAFDEARLRELAHRDDEVDAVANAETRLGRLLGSEPAKRVEPVRYVEAEIAGVARARRKSCGERRLDRLES